MLHPALRTISIVSIVVSALLVPSLLHGEPGSTAAEISRNSIRFKVTSASATRHDLAMIAARAEVTLGPVRIESWLEPHLIGYAGREYLRYDIGLPDHSAEPRLESLARIMTLSWDGENTPEKVVALLEGFDGVEYAEVISIPAAAHTPNDPDVQSGHQWHHGVIGSSAAWDVVRGKNSVVVAVLDTGIEPDHQDLAPSLWKNPGESGDRASNGIDDDGNGFVDDSWGWDFGGTDGVTPDNDPSNGNDPHGTHVAGIVGATGENAFGGAGVAYGVRLMSVKIGSDAYKAKLPHGYNGILYAAAMGADVINCSWGAPNSFSRAEQELVSYVRRDLGVVIVGAAGNNGREEAYYPASYADVISVASTRKESDRKAGTSNYHHTVDLVAPGEFVWSTWENNSYGNESGTSMAAPMVSAAAALLIGHDRSLSPDQVEMAIVSTTDDISLIVGQQYEGLLGSGRLNLFRAVTRYDSEQAAWLTDSRVMDEDGDGFIEPEEPVRLEFDVHNVLAPAENVSVTVEPVTPGSVMVQNATISLGPMESGATAVTPEDAFLLSFPEQTPSDTRVGLRVSVMTKDHVDRTTIFLNVYQTWGTTALNDIEASFNSVGNIAYNGMDKTQGDGFYYDGIGSLIWHGGLLLGTGPEQLADVVRKGPSALGTDNGFSIIEPYRVELNGDESEEIGRARFSDNEELGLEVSMTTVESTEDPDVLLLMYEIRNTGDLEITDLHGGIYVDWDLLTDGGFDQASYDSEYRLGFMRNSQRTDLTTGIALLSSQAPNYTAVNNASDGIPSSFDDELKWTMLSSGLYRETSMIDIDASMMIGAGPFSIGAGRSETIAFGIVLSEDHLGLRDATDRARKLYDDLTSVPHDPDVGTLMQLFPQPAVNELVVRIAPNQSTDGGIRVYDVAGRLVMSLDSRKRGVVRVDVGGLPTGVYRLQTSIGGSTVTRPFVVQR